MNIRKPVSLHILSFAGFVILGYIFSVSQLYGGIYDSK